MAVMEVTEGRVKGVKTRTGTSTGEREMTVKTPSRGRHISISHHSPGQLFFHPSAGLMWAQMANLEAAGHVGHVSSGRSREGMQELIFLSV